MGRTPLPTIAILKKSQGSLVSPACPGQVMWHCRLKSCFGGKSDSGPSSAKKCTINY